MGTLKQDHIFGSGSAALAGGAAGAAIGAAVGGPPGLAIGAAAGGAIGALVGERMSEAAAHDEDLGHFRQIFHTMPAEESAVSVVRAHADLIVELLHQDGSIVRARMSKSALLRGDDPVALATFQDLTERLWVDEL